MSASTKLCKFAETCPHQKKGVCKFAHPMKTGTLKRALTAPMKGGGPVTTHGKAVVKHAAYACKAVKDLARATAVIPGYVAVDRKDLKQSWADASEVEALQAQVAALKQAARAAIGGQHIRIKLYYSGSITGGAGAAIAGFAAVIPSNSVEWTSCTTLYDEARVDSLEIIHVAGVAVSGATSAVAGCVPYAIGYDPTYNTNPTSNEDVQESQFAQLALFGATINFSQAVCPVDFHRFHVKIPKDGVVVSEDMKAKTNFPGAWMSCLDTADSVGYLRYYVPALGGAAQNAIRYHVVVNCEFRIRT